MNRNKVAVALTVYNRADLIKETFDGLKNQTFKDFHVYLCWDGSTDNILEVVDSYAKDFPITLCSYETTTSVGSAKNKAVSAALRNNHQYIQILDSDDLAEPDMLKENAARLDQGDVWWVVCWSHTFGANSGTVRSQIVSLEDQCNKNYMHSWVMAKKEVFEKHNFRLDLNGIDDWDWWIRVYKDGYKGAIVEKELHKYRIHPGRVSATTGTMALFPELRKKVRAMNGINDKFTFHLVSLVHLPQSRKYNSCAFTQKNLKLSKMLTSLGHKVFFYGSEGSDVAEYVNNENFHFIQTHTLSDIRKAWGVGDNRFEIGYNFEETDYKHDFNVEPKTEATKKFYANCIAEINKRKQPDHFLLLTMGHYQQPIKDGVKLYLSCEPGIGYRGSVPGNYRAFESSYIQNFTYGSANPYQSINGSYYDRVIPNYFDPNDFEFSDTPGDYYLYIGRIIKRKGILTAALACNNLNKKLIIVGQGGIVLPNGNLTATTNPDFELAPGTWEYQGFADVPTRKKLMSKAIATFVATEYLECFGGTNVEARLSGSPAITTDFAVFPELIENGIDGYRCNTLSDFIWAADQCKNLDRNIVRKRAERFLMDNVKWDFQRWFEDLYKVYESTLGTGLKGWHRIPEAQPEWRSKITW